MLTRSDFDGLVCAALLKEKENISNILFVHPKDMQEKIIEIHPNDISANVPYVPGVYLCFDHHRSESNRLAKRPDNHILDPDAHSAARVIHTYYGAAFRNVSHELMEAVDKCDSASFTVDEILHPEKWILLNFIMDARTGLGRFKNFKISNYQLMMDLITYFPKYAIEKILTINDVKERVDLYFEHEALFKEQTMNCSTVYDNLVVTDIRHLDLIYSGNRFIEYALYPDTNISIRVLWGYKKAKTVFTVGKSIINQTSKHNIGKVMLSYGGGGHINVGTCQIENERAETVLKELIDIFNAE
ncbi:MAG: exopolyphosphatase [Salinispira sp.]